MAKTILVVEDDDEVRRVYQTVLGEFGEVRAAADLAQARGQLAGVDLIVLDYHLRGENATFAEALTELRASAPVLVCSGMPDPRVPAQGAELGAIGYWNKGSGLDLLRKKVRLALGL